MQHPLFDSSKRCLIWGASVRARSKKCEKISKESGTKSRRGFLAILAGAVVAFNTEERWSEDASEDVAHELRRRCDLRSRDLSSSIQDFVERHEGHGRRQLTLPLV